MLLSVVTTTVHTTGINWASVITIISSIVVASSIVFGFIARTLAHYIARQITTAIDRFRIEVIDSMDKRVSNLESNLSNERNRRR